MKINAFASTGPGRFGCRADERAYRVSLDGCTEEVGNVSEIGVWFGLLRFPLFGLAKAGAIIGEDDQGFVDVEFYNDPADLERAWNIAVHRVARKAEF